MEIARGCKGLPLAIVVIAGLLSTVSENPTSWLEIAENVESAAAEIEEILTLSYIQLPQYLRPCFLYMGSFPEDDEIHVKKLIRLWIAEGFIRSPMDLDSFEKVAEECLEELVKRNLVLVTEWKWDGRIKSCSLHDLMRDLCIKKAHESNFFLNVMDKYITEERFIGKVRNEHRISVDSSSLEFLPGLNGSNIHSIKCSQKHSRKLDFFESVRLLRVLDAEDLNVERSPSMDQLYEQFHLRYLAVIFRGSLSFVPKLQNLETLIIRQESRFIIWLSWCMSQLRHVYVQGQIQFDDPEESTHPLENLQTLSCVSHKSCTEKILKLLPNLKQLTVECDYSDGAVCLDDLVHLQRLENLKIFVDGWGGPKHYKITFPSNLKKLTLMVLNLSWDDIFVVDSFQNLQMLKLDFCTCVGGTWETIEGAFPALEVLSMKNAKLENWITERSHFPRLKRLLIHSCRDLNEIPNDIGEIPTLELIRVTGSTKNSLVESVEQIRQEQEDLGNTLEVLCSADAR